MSRGESFIRLTVTAIALALSGMVASVANPAEEPRADEEPREEIAKEREDSPSRSPGVTVLIPGWTPPKSARDYPLGVTIVDGSAPPARRRASSYPPGVTLLAGSGRSGGDSWVQIVVSATIETDAPISETPPPVVDLGVFPAGFSAMPEGKTIGPGSAEQLAAFGRLPVSAGTQPSASIHWVPTSSFPERDPGNSYPWNPVEWATPIHDPTWVQTPAWPPREEEGAYPWNPVSWPEPIIDPIWVPTDSWSSAGDSSSSSGSESDE